MDNDKETKEAKEAKENKIREAEAAYATQNKYGIGADKKQGEWTVEDYFRIPDDIRVEIIDGVIYDMAAPTKAHQTIAGEIFWQLRNCRKEHGMPCVPMIAPVDVQLGEDGKTVVQPDVLIVCDGSFDLVLEVISDSSRHKDTVIKLRKYRESGCREYWIVDPKSRKVMVFEFEKADLPKEYTFDDKIPVGISEGLCEVDFSTMEGLLEDGRRSCGPLWTE